MEGVEPHPEFPNIHSEYGVWRSIYCVASLRQRYNRNSTPLSVVWRLRRDGDIAPYRWIAARWGKKRPTAEGLFFRGAMGKKAPYRWIAARWGKKRPTVEGLFFRVNGA